LIDATAVRSGKEIVTKCDLVSDYTKRYTCTSDRHLSIRTVLQVAFNTHPLSLVFPVDTKLNGNINPVTGHEDPQG
jgi:hypothetical protein